MSDIKINKGHWDALSAGDQSKVKDILTASGLLEAGSRLVPDPGAAAPAAPNIFDDIKKPVCQAACTAAEAVAAGACAGLAPVAAAICVAAAHAAGEACRNAC